MKEEPIRVLVLEDQAQMRDALAEALTDEGYDVTVASRGEQAVAEAEHAPFDLLITDIRMDGMDGLEALQRVRQQQPGIHSLVVTGYSTEEDSIRAIRLGAGDYLKKPFKLTEFLSRVSRLVAERKEQLDKLRLDRSLREATLCLAWALSVARSEQAMLAGRIAGWLSDELGLPDQVPVVAAMVAAQSDPALVPLRQRPPFAALLSGFESWQEVSLERRVVFTAAIAAEQWQNLEDESAPSLGELLAGPQHDPFLVELLHSYPEPEQDLVEARLSRRPARERALLSLGRTLEQTGDAAGARRAYELVASQARGREAVAARLGLARLSPADSGLLQQAIEMARSQGPAGTAQTLLEAGLLAWHQGLEQAGPWLDEAEGLLGSLGSEASRVQATLALFALGSRPVEEAEAALNTLTRPSHLSELTSAAPWLFALLLESVERLPKQVLESVLLRLVQVAPTALEAALARPLSTPAQKAAVSLIAASGNPALESALQRLLSGEDRGLQSQAAQALQKLSGPEAPPSLIIRSLGPFEVLLGSERVPESSYKTAKVKHLLAFLALRGGKPVSDDVVLEAFWPGPVAKGKRSLNTALHRLRKCLRPAQWEGDLDYVARSAGQLQLNPEISVWHDLQELEQAAAEASRAESAGDSSLALSAHLRVAELYRGPYLEGCYMDWALAYRTRLEQTMVTSVSYLTDHYLQTDEAGRALEYAQRLLEHDPCSQEAYQQTMKAYLKLTRYADAVRLFKECQRQLRRELDMEPSVEMHRLHQMALMSQSSDLIG